MFLKRMPDDWSTAFRELDHARREMERLFGSLTGPGGFTGTGVFPALNVTETGDAVLVRAELPGVDPDDLEITVEDNTLTLAGERKIAEEGAQAGYHRREREGGRFRRSVQVPTRIEGDRVRASYEHGILTIEMPKAPEARPRQIAVQAQA